MLIQTVTSGLNEKGLKSNTWFCYFILSVVVLEYYRYASIIWHIYIFICVRMCVYLSEYVLLIQKYILIFLNVLFSISSRNSDEISFLFSFVFILSRKICPHKQTNTHSQITTHMDINLKMYI